MRSVDAAYERWTRSVPCDQSLAFAAYQAALEREEHASRVDEGRIDGARRWALAAGRADAGRAAA